MISIHLDLVEIMSSTRMNIKRHPSERITQSMMKKRKDKKKKDSSMIHMGMMKMIRTISQYQ